MRWLIIAMVLCLSTQAWGNLADAPLEPSTPDARQPNPEADTHPIVPADASWVVSLLLVVGGLFASAAVIGPNVRAELADAARLEQDIHTMTTPWPITIDESGRQRKPD